jgi:hypothetical protein
MVAPGGRELMPTGRPALLAGKLMPGIPPTLPGLVLRMKVGKVGTVGH